MSWDDQTVRWMLKPVLLAVVLLAVVAAPALADDGQQTTLLLTPSGQPVGGAWQQWMNNSYMPTYNGSMVLDLNYSASECNYGGLGHAEGCTGTQGFTDDLVPPVQSLPETGLDIAAFGSPTTSPAHYIRYARWTLLYEQAHVIDFKYLTDPERATFAAMWGRPVPTNMPVDLWWSQYDKTYAFGALNEWFAYDYMICALWPKLTWAIVDWNADISRDWNGFDVMILGPHPPVFPVLTISRNASYSVAKREWFYAPPAHHAKTVFATQLRSCGVIRGWLDASQIRDR